MAVGAEDHEVLDVRPVELDGAVHEVVETHGAFRDAHAHRARSAGLLALRDLRGAERAAGAIVFFSPGVALRLELLRRAIAVVRAALRDEARRHRAIAVETFGLKVRSVRAADFRTLIPVETQPPHAVEDS